MAADVCEVRAETFCGSLGNWGQKYINLSVELSLQVWPEWDDLKQLQLFCRNHPRSRVSSGMPGRDGTERQVLALVQLQRFSISP